MLTYNIKDKIDLTEDRTAKYSFQVESAIASGIVLLEDEDIIERVVCANPGSFEGDLTYGIYTVPSESFLAVCKRLAENHHPDINRHAITYAKKYLDMRTDPTEFELSVMEQRMLARADTLLNEAADNLKERRLVS